MTLGDWITWITLAAGAFALLRLAYRRWQPWLRYYAIIVYYAIDDYVQQSQVVRDDHPPAATPISAVVETETKAFPSVSNALETSGNSDFRFQSLEAANAYAETLLIDRLAELVLAEKLDKSIAIKVGMRAPTGRAYQAAKERLEAAMQKQQYPALTASRTKAAHSH